MENRCLYGAMPVDLISERTWRYPTPEKEQNTTFEDYVQVKMAVKRHNGLLIKTTTHYWAGEITAEYDIIDDLQAVYDDARIYINNYNEIYAYKVEYYPNGDINEQSEIIFEWDWKMKLYEEE